MNKQECNHQKEYVLTRKAEIQEYQKQYRLDNKDKIRQQRKEYQKSYRLNNHEKVLAIERKCSQRPEAKKRALEYVRKKKYNLTPEEYIKIFTSQNGGCAICNKTEEQLGEKLCVDHDHITGKVRGLLCKKHNLGISKFDDSPILLDKSSEYLRRYGK